VLVLALADRRPLPDPAVIARQRGVDAIFCLGDLDRAWIESLENVDVPVFGVHGNHDEEFVLQDLGIDDLHLRRTSLRGLTVAGFEGCVRYGLGGPHQFTQKEASKLARKLPSADVLLCHCPPRGVNDDPADPAHIGFDGLRKWVDRHKPRHLLHGHVHPIAGEVMTRYGDTRVHFIRGVSVLNIC
jgi:Icc-related predicted phosphoesterase